MKSGDNERRKINVRLRTSSRENPFPVYFKTSGVRLKTGIQVMRAQLCRYYRFITQSSVIVSRSEFERETRGDEIISISKPRYTMHGRTAGVHDTRGYQKLCAAPVGVDKKWPENRNDNGSVHWRAARGPRCGAR